MGNVCDGCGFVNDPDHGICRRCEKLLFKLPEDPLSHCPNCHCTAVRKTTGVCFACWSIVKEKDEYKLWLDDERTPPEDWIWVKTAPNAIKLLETGKIHIVSLDHDLGDDPAVGNGYDVILWIEQAVLLENYNPPAIMIHTANPPARDKMKAGAAKIDEYWQNLQMYGNAKGFM